VHIFLLIIHLIRAIASLTISFLLMERNRHGTDFGTNASRCV